MAKRTPPPGLKPWERQAWRELYKNRNRHSVKLTDAVEADFQVWRINKGIATVNAAIIYLISTHPEL